ncbi:MAG: TetR/AcrR family transcriptional regulator [Clostridia bacterium]|nr:TetR/AcrR family transcriptional regulator [Clostridia bacterium]
MSETRLPKQQGAIDKRNRIIEKGFELMCEKGYYNVSTPEIAKVAGVSTGIIYQYFSDKKDIFIEGVKNYSNSIMFPMLQIIEKSNEIKDFNTLLDEIIDKFIASHTMSEKAHEQLLAMSHLDSSIAEIINTSELEMTENISMLLEKNNIMLNNSLEKVHIIYGILDNYCHEVVYHKHDKIDYNIMKENVKEIILFVLKNR